MSGCFAWARADADSAREVACPMGVRWGSRLNSEAAARVSRRYAAWAGGWVRAGHRAAAWDRAGMTAGRAQGLDWASSLSVPGVPRADRRYYWLALPCWVTATLFAVLPAHRAWTAGRRRRASRRAKGLCVHCGYNLTGNVSGVCPECGTVSERATA